MPPATHCIEIFLECHRAVRAGELIRRASRKDKEFHFQDWFKRRLDALRLSYDPPARNSYPDFRLVTSPEGYEVKGLAFPGREASYDSNSQVPSGFHNGRAIYYLFGRYPKDPETDEYPVIDLVMCHGDFLNADHKYIHKNKSVRGFGSYGDIMIRDRKMYVAPTPFALTEGTTGQCTLVLPRSHEVHGDLAVVGELVREETRRLVVGYSFNLSTNTLTPKYVENPDAGKVHEFIAYRVVGTGGTPVKMKPIDSRLEEILQDED